VGKTIRHVKGIVRAIEIGWFFQNLRGGVWPNPHGETKGPRYLEPRGSPVSPRKVTTDKKKRTIRGGLHARHSVEKTILWRRRGKG